MSINRRVVPAQVVEHVIEKWQREIEGYVMGAMLPEPVGDMNRASADVARRILRDLRSILPMQYHALGCPASYWPSVAVCDCGVDSPILPSK